MREHNESKCGEPWGITDGILHDADGFTLTLSDITRAKDCVNACAGVSDEEVQGGLVSFIRISPQLTAISETIDQKVAPYVEALTSDLADAVGLLELVLKGYDESRYSTPGMMLAAPEIEDFITRQRGD